MKNPAFKIWRDGQIILLTILGIYIFSSAARPRNFGDEPGLEAMVSIIGFGLEFVFSLPAILWLLMWIDQLKSWKLGNASIVALTLAVYIPFLYLCARILGRTIIGHWRITQGIDEIFYLYTGIALTAAAIGMLINYRRLIGYVNQPIESNADEATNPCQNADPES